MKLAAALVVFAIAFAPAAPADAKTSCTADATLLGQLPGFTGPTSTDWFNAFGFGLDTTRSWSVSFSVPVMPFPGMSPAKGPLTTFAIPTALAGSDGTFKTTFRARDTGVSSIRITVTDGVCTASHVLSFVPNTATVTARDPLGRATFALPALAGAAFAAALILLLPSRRQSQRSSDIQ